MSKLYAIEAREGWFDGLHGVVSHYVGEYASYEEACEDAMESSYEVMDDYRICEQAGWDEAALDEGFEEDTDEYEEYINDCRSENIAYSVWEIKETTESLDALNDKFYNDPEGFIEEYCIQN